MTIDRIVLAWAWLPDLVETERLRDAGITTSEKFLSAAGNAARGLVSGGFSALVRPFVGGDEDFVVEHVCRETARVRVGFGIAVTCGECGRRMIGVPVHVAPTSPPLRDRAVVPDHDCSGAGTVAPRHPLIDEGS